MNLLLVEDEQRVAEFIQRGLRAEGWTVLHAPDGETALGLLETDDFDVTVLDLILPGISGQDVCRLMRARQDFTPVLMLSALDRTDDRVAGLRLGADDYLVKPFDFDELVARIQALARRSSAFRAGDTQANLMQLGELTYNTKSLEVTVAGRIVPMTEKERGILQLFLGNPDKIYSRERILNAVWGANEDPLTNIVDVYIGRLRKKLGSAGEAIETVRGAGYRLSSNLL